jgi:hypothetical protein
MEFYLVTEEGIALDDWGNEVRDEDGQIIIVPDNEMRFYNIAKRYDEQ